MIIMFKNEVLPQASPWEHFVLHFGKEGKGIP